MSSADASAAAAAAAGTSSASSSGPTAEASSAPLGQRLALDERSDFGHKHSGTDSSGGGILHRNREFGMPTQGDVEASTTPGAAGQPGLAGVAPQNTGNNNASSSLASSTAVGQQPGLPASRTGSRFGSHIFSNDPHTQWVQIQEEAMAANREGMQELRNGNPPPALRLLTHGRDLLERAESFISADDRIALSSAQALTASNLGIYHKRHWNHKEAVGYLQRSLELYEVSGADIRTIVASHLNLCVCYLHAEIPEEALQNARTAVELEGRLIAASKLDSSNVERSHDTGSLSGAPGNSIGNSGDVRPDDYATLAIAYHKVAEAHEMLREWGEATLAYTQAYEVVVRSLGPNHHLAKTFEKSTRCPHRTRPPEVPRCWKTASAMRPLPSLPCARQGQGSSAQAPSVTQDLWKYQLNEEVFAAWPPKTASKEDRQWYAMAQKHRDRQKHLSISQIRGLNVIGTPRK